MRPCMQLHNIFFFKVSVRILPVDFRGAQFFSVLISVLEKFAINVVLFLVIIAMHIAGFKKTQKCF